MPASARWSAAANLLGDAVAAVDVPPSTVAGRALDGLNFVVGVTSRLDPYHPAYPASCRTPAKAVAATVEHMRGRRAPTPFVPEDIVAKWELEDRARARLRLTTVTAALRWVEQRPIQRAVYATRHAFQRLRRGWDDRALWSLDTHVTGTLADQLDELARISRGWPASETHPTFTSWQDALRCAASDLRAYANRSRHPAQLRYEEAVITPNNHEEKRRRMLDALCAERELHDRARRALAWVGDNLEGLWD